MSKGKAYPGMVSGLSLMLAVALSGVAVAAPAPVEESRPMGQSTGVRAVVSQVSDEPVMTSSSADSSRAIDDDEFNPTAHLLNTIAQLRQEMMEMRGVLEEHAFRIEQLQQENRDRYLDLDERLSRLNSQAGSVGADLHSSKTNMSTVNVEATPGQSVLQAEQAAYKSAFGYIRSRQFDEARMALQEQLKTYPDGAYTDNARYWLGEVDMAQGRYDDARESFQVILSEFPESPKVPDASYKLGRVHDLLGHQQKARELLESVVQQYPDSAAAKLSDTYLKTMGGS